MKYIIHYQIINMVNNVEIWEDDDVTDEYLIAKAKRLISGYDTLPPIRYEKWEVERIEE